MAASTSFPRVIERVDQWVSSVGVSSSVVTITVSTAPLADRRFLAHTETLGHLIVMAAFHALQEDAVSKTRSESSSIGFYESPGWLHLAPAGARFIHPAQPLIKTGG